MNKAVLIINTDTAEVRAIKENLSSPNTKIICVSSMDEALRIIGHMEICLIILDAKISAENDHQLLAAIQRSKITPILILSSQSCHVERMRVFQAGAHAYIVNHA